jgi:hypothetical protein
VTPTHRRKTLLINHLPRMHPPGHESCFTFTVGGSPPCHLRSEHDGT